jgi:hypothetical protein
MSGKGGVREQVRAVFAENVGLKTSLSAARSRSSR